MALILDTSLSGSASNSYVDVAYCDDYWANHILTQRAALWAALTNSQKINLLIRACGVVETLRFTSTRSLPQGYELSYDRRLHEVIALNKDITPVRFFYYQKLQFPRNLDRDFLTGQSFVPEPVKIAQCEQAGYLLSFDESALSASLQGISHDQAKVGSLSTRQNLRQDGTSIAPMALEQVRPYLLKSSVTMGRG
jgi:hypothetical protein